jgi:5'-3' exonuclease
MTTLLVDGPNLLMRADFAAKGKQVAMSVGETNTAALVIFVNMISKYIRMVEPGHVLVCWDSGHAFRDEAYPAYKAARKKPEDPTRDTIPFALAKEFLTYAGIPHKALTGYEADDLIAATVRQCLGEVVILSGDKDLLQLVSDDITRTRVTQIRVPDDTPWDEVRVDEKFGVPPHHLPSYLALVGDPGDGVPGLKGIGPKKAVKMLAEAEWDWEALMDMLGPETAAEARLMRSLVDLRYYDYPEVFMLANRRVPAFFPTTPGQQTMWASLRSFCAKYRLTDISDRLARGALWADPETVSAEDFDALPEVGQ